MTHSNVNRDSLIISGARRRTLRDIRQASLSLEMCRTCELQACLTERPKAVSCSFRVVHSWRQSKHNVHMLRGITCDINEFSVGLHNNASKHNNGRCEGSCVFHVSLGLAKAPCVYLTVVGRRT